MIVAFEGIDGAGKTTTAPYVAAKLNEHGLHVIEASKRHPSVANSFAREQLEVLAGRLWGVPHDARLDSLGTAHWVYLNAAYFAGTHFALSQELGTSGIAIFDNWINKFVARISLSSTASLSGLLDNLSYLPQPDLVFMLDTPVQVAGRRKAQASELERGVLYDGRDDFGSYQERVRDTLLKMADAFQWIIVETADKRPQEIAEHVSAEIIRRLRADVEPAPSFKNYRSVRSRYDAGHGEPEHRADGADGAAAEGAAGLGEAAEDGAGPGAAAEDRAGVRGGRAEF